MPKKSDSGSGFKLFIMGVVLFVGGYYLGVYRQPVFTKFKEVVPPLVKKAEIKVRGMFGIEKDKEAKGNRQ
ncbi:MAG: hypothetical protein HQL26_02660 [Candidatus Omnitrophica bacterium]|nr:hypothetical protein [Candidatus Omnitrophota bacterium]